jgi:dATP pyrophosphohydrolase
MARAKYQVLVLPYQKMHGKILYCVFKRSDMDAWQFLNMLLQLNCQMIQ